MAADNVVVAIIDDDESVRTSTAFLLNHAKYTCELFASGDAFLAVEPNAYGCILLDMRMPGTDGIGVLRKLGERDECAPVVVLTGHGDIQLAVTAMKLGAVDFIEKPYTPEKLLLTMENAIASRSPVEQSVQSAEAQALVDALSARQRQVLCGLLKGSPNKVIAWNLGLSTRTVEAHRAQVMDRLGVRSIAEAVRIAMEAGLQPTPDIKA